MKSARGAKRRPRAPKKAVISVEVPHLTKKQLADLTKLFRAVAVAVVGPRQPTGIEKQFVSKRTTKR